MMGETLILASLVSRRHVKGFTLVEVLITLTILTFVLALSYQSLSVFLKAASKNRGHYQVVQSESLLRLKLRSSIRSMLDYYVVAPDGLNQPLFFATDEVIQYVSLSPIIYDRDDEVFVSIMIDNEQNKASLVVTECLLSSVMPHRLDEFPYETPQSCLQAIAPIEANAIEFNIQSENKKTDTSNNFLMNLPGFGASQDIAQNTTKHLLPTSVEVVIQKANDTATWRFYPQVENLNKYFALDGFKPNA